ncbi:MAG: biotin/lipoyl-binding protein [Holophagales bacterium]|nr:biotin/lipoyl-binding protein [Holophagales bacterium]
MKLKNLATGTVHETTAERGEIPRGARAVRDGLTTWVHYRGEIWRLARLVERPGAREEEEHDLRAPMPGVVARVLAEEGQAVEKGTPLLVLSAMKMEHEIRSPRPGRLAKLFRAVGERVDMGDPLAEIE